MAQLLNVDTFQLGSSQAITSTFQASNADVLIAGNVQTTSGEQTAAIISLSPVQSRAWRHTIATRHGNTLAAIAEIGNGTYVAVGQITVSPAPADQNIWLVNIDNEGNVLRQITADPSGMHGGGHAIAGTADGGFIVTGIVIDAGSNRAVTLVMKYDAAFALQWRTELAGSVAYAVVQAASGAYVVAGARAVSLGVGSVFAAMLDPDGVLLWQRAYDDHRVVDLFAAGLAETTGGNFVIAAMSALISIDASGSVIWSRFNAALGLQSVATRADGALVVSGMCSLGDSHAYVAVLSADGSSIVWDNTEISADSLMAQAFVSTQGYVTAGGYVPYNVTAGTTLMALAVYNPAPSVS